MNLPPAPRPAAPPTVPPTPPGTLRLLGILLAKEALLLRRRPAALMAVGLLLLMSVMVSLEVRSGQAQSRSAARAAALPCLLLHRADDPLIPYLRRHAEARLPLRFQAVPADQPLRAPPGLACAAELDAPRDPGDGGLPLRQLVVRHGEDRARAETLARWLLAGLGAQAAGLRIQQSLQPLPAAPEAAARPAGLGRIDLSAAQTRGLVGTMLLFSAQFFVACALFISLAGQERERGIAQALALSPAGPGLSLLAKALFHLLLASAASAAMLAVLAPQLLGRGLTWAVLLPTSLGLIAMAILIVSLSRSQTAASLGGFCYLMGVGVVMALSGSFPAFQLLRGLMFESHALAMLGALLTPTPQSAVVLSHGLIGMALSVPLLLALAAWVGLRRGWRQP